MGYVYRYTDLEDGVIKYVGIVWSPNRTLYQRIKEHTSDDWCKNKRWKIEYLVEDINSRTDAEYMEAHFISLFQTDKYFNVSKSGWGISSFVPNRDDWQLYNLKEKSELHEAIEKSRLLEQENIKLNIKIEKMQKTIDVLNDILIQKTKPKEEKIETKQNQHELEDKTPSFILNGGLYNGKYKKNKSINDKESLVASNSYFYKRSMKISKHHSIPCKLMLYENGKKKEWRYFDSISKCSDFCGLSCKQIIDSMTCTDYYTYYEWRGSYFIGLGNFDVKYRLSSYNILIRVCAITPPTQKGKNIFNIKRDRCVA